MRLEFLVGALLPQMCPQSGAPGGGAAGDEAAGVGQQEVEHQQIKKIISQSKIGEKKEIQCKRERDL